MARRRCGPKVGTSRSEMDATDNVTAAHKRLACVVPGAWTLLPVESLSISSTEVRLTR